MMKSEENKRNEWKGDLILRSKTKCYENSEKC